MQTPSSSSSASGRNRPALNLRLLVVEDDVQIAEGLRSSFAAQGYQIALAHDGEAGLEQAATGGFDVLIIDRMLPRRDGLSLLRSLRAKGVATPALVLSALGSLQDRVDGFDEGCDDYLVKPFAFQELNARVLALSRRRGPGSGSESTVLQAGGLNLDRLNREVVREGVRIDLLPLEFRLLEVLMLHAGTPVTRTMMLEKVWGFRFDPRTNIVETHISHLRAKLDQPGRPQPIRTIRGSGYVICAERPH